MTSEKTRATRGQGAKRLAYADNLDVTRKEMVAFEPSAILVKWSANASRSCLYSYKGEPCCFRPEDVEDLVLPMDALARVGRVNKAHASKVKTASSEEAADALMEEREAAIREIIAEQAGHTSLLRLGQESPITVYYNGHKRPVLVSGNRRLYAFLIMEDYGLLTMIPVAHGKAGHGKVEAIAIEQPKDPAGWLRIASSNLAENEKKQCSPIDIAWALRRFSLPDEEGGVFGLGHAEAGKRVAALLGMSLHPRSVARYLQLLALPMGVQGAVHRGEVRMNAALKIASEQGHGGALGERTGVKHSRLRTIPTGRLAELAARRSPSEDRLFTAKEVERALLHVAGLDVSAPSWLTKLLEDGEEAVRAAKESARPRKKTPSNRKAALEGSSCT